jgi:DNA-binding transcriptional LysR family regulator
MGVTWRSGLVLQAAYTPEATSHNPFQQEPGGTMRGGTKYLDTFVAAVEAGSFTRAAEMLHVTPSTVSYQIKQLEQWLGSPLFERSGRRVLPSASGERLYTVCGRFMGELAALKSAVHGSTGAARAVLRIATGSSFGRYVLTPILAREDYQEAVVDLRFGSDEEVWAAVANGRADVGFAYTLGASNTLSFELIYRYPLVLIGAAAQPVSREDGDWIGAQSFITYDDCETTFGRWFEIHLGGMPAQLRTSGHCTEIEEAVALVAAGRGLSIVPGHTLHNALLSGSVRVIAASMPPTAEDTVFHVSRLGSFEDPAIVDLLTAIRNLNQPPLIAQPQVTPQLHPKPKLKPQSQLKPHLKP